MPIAIAEPKPATLDERSPSFERDQNMSGPKAASPEVDAPEFQPETTGDPFLRMTPNPRSDGPSLNGLGSPVIDMTPAPSSSAEPVMHVEVEFEEEGAEDPELAKMELIGGLPEHSQELVSEEQEPPQDTSDVEPDAEKQAAEEAEGEEQGEIDPSEGEIGEDEQTPETPRSPEDDPAFQATVSRISGTASRQKTHSPAQTEAQAAQAAAPSPANETESIAQSRHVEEMDRQEPGTFDAEGFKSMLMARIEAILPRDEEEADRFSDDNRMDEVRDAAAQRTEAERERAAGAIESSATSEPDTASVEERETVPLEEKDPGRKPGDIGAAGAMPDPRPDAEVSLPLQENVNDLEQTTEDAGVTDGQLAESGESKFIGALDKKIEAKEHARESPAEFRENEQSLSTNTRAGAQRESDEQLEGMHDDRAAIFAQVTGEQEQSMAGDTAERQQVADHIDRIYEGTKEDVEEILSSLDEEVTRRFDHGAERARLAFENFVERKMNAYKKERYGEWYDVRGWGRRAGDVFTGLPDEVNDFFMEGRQLYINRMDVVLSDIADYVAGRLNAAKQRINQGKQQVQDYVTSLPERLQEVGREAAEAIQSRFDDLEQNVDSKQDELVDSLAQQYSENLQAVDARIEEMQAENRGLIDAAIGALVGVIETILEIKQMLTNLLRGAVAAVTAIISDPIGFLKNLIRGIKEGFMNFVSRIWEHLKSGLVGWLTGALGPTGIQIPDDLFSLKGIFSLVMQVLGLTWDYVREKAVKLFGERVVQAFETGLEIFQVLRTEGISGLWEYVKEQFNDLKETVIDAIKDMVITQVIQAGVKWVMGLLSPAGAFVKAAMMIIDVVKFFIERGRQIMELVNAFTESILAIASGNVTQVARKIEDALKTALPVVISFLASLLGLSGLAKRVQDLIKRIRKRVDDAITKLLKKAREMGKNLLAKLGIGKDKTKPDPRSQDEKRKDLDDATKEANRYLDEKDANPEEVREKLPGLKTKYDLTETKLKQNPRNEKYYIELNLNPKSKTDEELLEGATSGDYERIGPYIVNFNSPKEKYEKEFPGEYEAQIVAQVTALNQMKVSKWLKNRKAFIKRKIKSRSGRDQGSAKLQRDFRKKKKNEMKIELLNNNPNMSPSEAEEIVEDRMSKLAALHDPDQIAGGEVSSITRLGARNINSSIGAQWRYRIGDLTSHVKDEMKKVPDKNKPTVKMNVDYKLG